MAKKKVVVRKSRVVKTRNNGTMSESQYFSKIRSSLRQAFRYWKPMQNVLEISSRPSQSLNKRLKKEYQCAHCKNWFKRDDVQIDHVEECGSLNKYEDIVPFIIRLTKEEPEAYQILCKQHHKEKTDKYISSKKVKK
jgi:ubiquinone/menaquinone biosynthesis C-methylase UbiE